MGTMRERSQLVDVFLAAGLVLVLSWISYVSEPYERPADKFSYMLILGLGALLLLRRRWAPAILFASLGILIIYHLMGYPGIGLALPLAPALYSTAEFHRSKWPGWAAVTLVFTFLVWKVVTSTTEKPPTDFVTDAGPDIALMAAVIALGDSVRARRSMKLRTQRLLEVTAEQERSQAQAASAEERTRIAQELHDALGHQVTLISTHSHVAREAIRQDPAAAESSLAIIGETSRRMMSELRQTVSTLRSRNLAPTPVSLENLESTLFKGSPIEVRPEISISSTLPEPVSRAAYRIIQEALNNIAKHSRARQARVTITEEDEELAISVQDDGPRYSRVRGETEGFGLIGMAERCEALGGRLKAEPLNDGFRVSASLPLKTAVTGV